MSDTDHWDTASFSNSSIIRQLSDITSHFADYSAWPDLTDYQQLFKKHKLNIRPVTQARLINTFEEKYESRVYLQQELQTRLQNWHDFFNAMIWLKFPQTKRSLNRLHYLQASHRAAGSNRSKLENRITQFDECGAILISNNSELLKLVENHQWQELFVTHKNAFENSFHCVVFGHAIFEKALTPYIGLTCHCLLINDNELLQCALRSDYTLLDEKIAGIWQQTPAQQPLQLLPYPVLGSPGYWPEQNDQFYQNKNYFR